MLDDPRHKRKGKRLLVASLGVAAVSYLALQSGCTEDAEDIPLVANLLAPPLDASFESVITGDAAAPGDGGFDALVGTGNLLPPPPTSRDASTDALVTSGNLLPPPPDAGADAAASDAKVDTSLPTSGNLLPPPKPQTWLPPPPARGEQL